MQGLRTLIGPIAVCAALAPCFAATGCSKPPVGVVLTYKVDQQANANRPVDVSDLVDAIKRRVKQAATVRALDNDRVEVGVYGQPTASDLATLKQLVSGMGKLEFRILADSTYANDQPTIEAAKAAPQDRNEIQVDGETIAKWVAYDEAELGLSMGANGLIKRKVGETSEILVLMDAMNVTGEYLTSAEKTKDENGGPAIDFALDEQGEIRFSRLTGQNVPDIKDPQVYRRLGIILDNRLLSAPAIRSAIGRRGMLSGGSLKDPEIDVMLTIFQEGTLPARIRLVDEKRVDQAK